MNLDSLPFTIRPKKAKIVMLLLLDLAFLVGTAMKIRSGASGAWYWFALFALGIPIFGAQLHPRCSFLTATDEGIEICDMFRRRQVRWDEISEFGLATVRNGRQKVGFNYAAQYRRASNRKPSAQFDDTLPETYGMSAETLARLLADHHRGRRVKREADAL
jgi:hypothetical protein